MARYPLATGRGKTGLADTKDCSWRQRDALRRVSTINCVPALQSFLIVFCEKLAQRLLLNSWKIRRQAGPQFRRQNGFATYEISIPDHIQADRVRNSMGPARICPFHLLDPTPTDSSYLLATYLSRNSSIVYVTLAPPTRLIGIIGI